MRAAALGFSAAEVDGVRDAVLLAIELLARTESSPADVPATALTGARVGIQLPRSQVALARLAGAGAVEIQGGTVRFSAEAEEIADTELLPAWRAVLDAVPGETSAILAFWAYWELWRARNEGDGWAVVTSDEVGQVTGLQTDTLRRARRKLTDAQLLEIRGPSGAAPEVRPGRRAVPTLHAAEPILAATASSVNPAAPAAEGPEEMVIVLPGVRLRVPLGTPIELLEGQTARMERDLDGTLVMHVEERR